MVYDRLRRTAVRTFRKSRDDDVGFLAAAVTYYALVSVFPLLLLLLVLGSLVGRESVSAYVFGLTGDYVSPAVRSVLVDSVAEGARGRGGATVAGVVVLTWGALRVFRGLDTAFSRIYGTDHDEGFVGTVVDALAVLVSVALAVVVSSLWSALELPPVVRTVSLVVLLVVTVLPVYYVFPDAELSVREALPGAVLAAVSVTVLRVAFEVYASNMTMYGAYGVVGAFLLLATWLYIASVSLLVGACLNNVVAQSGDPTDSRASRNPPP